MEQMIKRVLSVLVMISLLLTMTQPTVIYATEVGETSSRQESEEETVVEETKLLEDKTTESETELPAKDTNEKETASPEETAPEETTAEEATSEEATPEETTAEETAPEETAGVEETTQSSEETDAADEEKQPRLSPRTSQFSANSLSVNVKVQDTFRTFVDRASGMDVPRGFSIVLDITNNTTGLSGGKIQIPLDCIPGNQLPYENFDSEYHGIPIFSWDESTELAADSMVESYKVEDNESGMPCLNINLKDPLPAKMETIDLFFKFNSDYINKIPRDFSQMDNAVGSILWEIKPSVHVGEDKRDLATYTIRSTASSFINPGSTRSTRPEGDDGYPGNGLEAMIMVEYDKFYDSELDTDFPSYIYLDVPTDFAVKATKEFGRNEDITLHYKEEPLVGPKDAAEGQPALPAGYTRYIKLVSDEADTWNFPAHNESIDDRFDRLYMRAIEQTELEENDRFHITSGAVFKKVNGPIVTQENKMNFRKIDKPWDFYLHRYHGHASGRSSACGIADGDVGIKFQHSDEIFAGYSAYGHDSTTKNRGEVPINDVRMELYPTNGKASEKLNYHQIRAIVKTEEGAKPCYFQFSFEITDTSVESGTSNPEIVTDKQKLNSTFAATLPVLSSTEYISKVILTPWGADGNSEGDLAPGNLICIEYQPEAWPDQKWPDGQPVPTDNHSVVPMRWTLYYDNEGGQDTQYHGNTRRMFYIPKDYSSAYAEMFSEAAAAGVKPGQTFTYTLKGYNHQLYTPYDWVNPRIVIAVPKQMEMVDDQGKPLEQGKADVIRVKGRDVKKDAVEITRLADDPEGSYYFYELQLTDYTAKPQRAEPEFNINLNFKVADGTPAKTYPIPAAAVTIQDSEGFFQIEQETNNLDEYFEKWMELSHNYTGAAEESHTPLNVLKGSNLSTQSFVFSSDTGGEWSDKELVLAANDETVKMKLELKNSGNSAFNNVRLYDILPRDKDPRGSTGDISFAGFDGDNLAGATIYYTTTPIDDLQSYDNVNLNDFNASNWAGGTWSTQAPPNIEDVTAIYVEFGQLIVNASETIDVVMKFKIPAAGTQKAFNAFRFQATEVESGNQLEANSRVQGFGTTYFTLNYDSGIKSGGIVLVEGETDADNMPENQSGSLISGEPDRKFPIGTKIPTLQGYDFSHWLDEETGEVYHPEREGQNVFTFLVGDGERNAVILTAKWTPKEVKVTYDKNGGEGEAVPGAIDYKFQDKLSAKNMPTTVPTWQDHIFAGWSLEDDSAVIPDFGPEHNGVIDFVEDKTAYAVWKYNLVVEKKVENGGSPDKSFTFEVEFTKSDMPYTEEVPYVIRDADGQEVSNAVTDASGKATFTLKHGQSAIFKGFTAGPKDEYDNISYKVTETPDEYYTTYIGSSGNQANKNNVTSGTVNRGDSKEVFVNVRNDIVPTGVSFTDLPFVILIALSLLGFIGVCYVKYRVKSPLKKINR